MNVDVYPCVHDDSSARLQSWRESCEAKGGRTTISCGPLVSIPQHVVLWRDEERQDVDMFWEGSTVLRF